MCAIVVRVVIFCIFAANLNIKSYDKESYNQNSGRDL